MAQQTFSGVPGDFSAGQVLTAADMDKLREFLLYLIKEGDETDTGEVSPVILDLGNDRVGINTDTAHESLDVAGNLGVDLEITFGTRDNSDIIGYINFHGYQGGNTQYRDLGIYDGRQGVLAVFDGSAGQVAIKKVATLAYETLDVEGNIGVETEITYGTTHNADGWQGYINFHGYLGGNTKYRNLGIYDGKQGRMMLFTGSTGVVHCDNEFTAGTKTFDIAHPIKGGDWRLRHASVEGPRHDLIYRGTVTLAGGTATVDLDEVSGMTAGTWEALCRDPWTMAASSGNAVEWVLDGSTLTITGPAGAVCNWMVMAERHDAQVKGEKAPSSDDDGHLVTEYERDEPEPNTPTE